MNGYTETDVVDQRGKCFIVTGANTGLGFEVSRVLAARGARVLLACRDGAKADEAITRIKKITPDADLAFLPLDLADLESIRKAADVAAREPRIDALINNAGVMMPPLSRTKQGFELQFGVNHLGCFALSCLLLPKLSETPGTRIVITASLAHKSAKGIDWDDLSSEKGYSRGGCYVLSKLANLLFLSELDRRLRKAGSSVIAVGCHPGVATTELSRHTGVMDVVQQLIKPLLNTPAMGAWPTLLAATGAVRPGGYYGPTRFFESRGPAGEASRSTLARDSGLSQRLWDVSIALTGVDPGLRP